MVAASLSPVAAAEEETEIQQTSAEEFSKPPIDTTHPLYKPLELAYKSRDALKELKDYDCVFSKQEVIDRRLKATSMRLKFREEPFSVYLLFINPNAGREVIFVQGKNNNQLLVHETGVKALAGTVSLDPKSKDAMADNKYPVTMIGMKNMLDKIIKQWEKEGKFAETAVQYYPEAKLGDVACMVIESKHPEKRDDFKFQMTRLYIETKTQFPVRVEQYDFPDRRETKRGKDGPLVEEYTYSQIKANIGLKDKDFDHTNPNYAFPK
jgi:hypothetical protein